MRPTFSVAGISTGTPVRVNGVAVGQVEIAGARFVGVIDNFVAPRLPGTIRWIQAERCSSLVLVRPVK